MQAKKIYIGSWFQRTTLHLSEVYDFLKSGESPLDLDKKQLKKLQRDLNFTDVENVYDDLEYITATTKDGTTFKMFEDGLIVLDRDPGSEIKDDIERLTSFYEKEVSGALGYLFSLGAPIPKELANIKTIYPYFIVFENESEEDIHALLKEFKQDKHFEIKKDTFDVYRGNTLYIVNLKGESLENVERFIYEQIFIREFKGQLHRYLNIHRIIWENIAEVKERGSIKGTDIGAFRAKIESYQKSINLIGTRISQMGSYIGTRGSILKDDPEMEKFADVLQFKYETLSDTLSYIQDIWSMTSSYVDSALNVFSDLQSSATNSSIQNLTVVTSMGVGGTLLGLFANDSLPTFTAMGVAYFFTLALIGWTTNKVMKKIALNRQYSIKDIKAATDIR